MKNIGYSKGNMLEEGEIVMNIGIVATNSTNQLTGISRVTVDTLNEIKKIDTENSYYLIQGDTYGVPIINTREWLLPGFRFENIEDILCRTNEIDILYSFYPSIDVKIPCKKVLTIHDLIPLMDNGWFRKEIYDRFDGPIRKSAEEADKIIAMSEFTKRDIIKYYGIDENKIEVIYSGIQPAILSKGTDVDVHKKYNIKDRYILSVCTMDPRKNLKGLIDAFLNFGSRHPKDELQLVLTGKAGWDSEIVAYIQRCQKNHDDIILTGFVSDEDLCALTRKALAIAYVSFCEGFGLPILEGMAAGKAVISSNTSSMPEVGGDAVVYCNPYDMESIIDAMEQVVDNEAYRKELERRALKRAGLFSYEKTAQQVLKVLREVGKC